MFTGIVQGTAELVAIEEQPNFRTHVIRMPSREWGKGWLWVPRWLTTAAV